MIQPFLSAGRSAFRIRGEPNAVYAVDSSENLIDWYFQAHALTDESSVETEFTANFVSSASAFYRIRETYDCSPDGPYYRRAVTANAPLQTSGLTPR